MSLRGIAPVDVAWSLKRLTNNETLINGINSWITRTSPVMTLEDVIER